MSDDNKDLSLSGNLLGDLINTIAVENTSASTASTAGAVGMTFTLADLEKMIEALGPLPSEAYPFQLGLMQILEAPDEVRMTYTAHLPIRIVRPQEVIKISTCDSGPEPPVWVPARLHHWDNDERHWKYHLRIQKKWNKRFGMKRL